MQGMKVICKNLRDEPRIKQILKLYDFEGGEVIVNTAHGEGANIIWFAPRGTERYDRMTASMNQAMRYYDWRAADDE